MNASQTTQIWTWALICNSSRCVWQAPMSYTICVRTLECWFYQLLFTFCLRLRSKRGLSLSLRSFQRGWRKCTAFYSTFLILSGWTVSISIRQLPAFYSKYFLLCTILAKFSTLIKGQRICLFVLNYLLFFNPLVWIIDDVWVIFSWLVELNWKSILFVCLSHTFLKIDKGKSDTSSLRENLFRFNKLTALNTTWDKR